MQALPSLQVASLAKLTQPLLTSHESLVHTLLSSHWTALPAWHLLPLHTSPLVQALPSLQVASLAKLTQPLLMSHESLVHTLLSSQLSAAPAWHLVFLHASPTVQALPSVQGKVLAARIQPLPGSQRSVVQRLLSSQLAAAPAWHWLALQMSPVVQALSSEQGAVLAANTQPWAGSHESSVHGLLSLQGMALPGWHRLSAHRSPLVQRLSSEQATVLAETMQPAVMSHESSVHGLLSLQVTALPGWHRLSAHRSPLVQALLSVHVAVLAKNTHPFAASHESSVQALLSSQTVALPGRHWLSLQLSPTVQALLSEHDALLAMFTQPALGSHESSVHGLPSAHRPLLSI